MKSILFLPLFIISVVTYAQTDEQRKTHFNTNAQNVVNDGYDPVSYFNGKPLKGKEENSLEYKGLVYWFVSAQNRTKFTNNPQKFEPQYGGWCAYALGLEPQKVKVDPETYKIIDGKLYLFYNFGFTNTLKSWNKDEANLLPLADRNWDVLID